MSCGDPHWRNAARRRFADDDRNACPCRRHRDGKRYPTRIGWYIEAITDFSIAPIWLISRWTRFQRRGIGRELIRRTHVAAGLKTSLILLAAPKAETYYPHSGCSRTIRAGESSGNESERS